MIDGLARVVTERTRRILVLAGVLFLVAAAVGVPVVTILKSESSDFQDPHAQNQQVLRAIEHTTGQAAGYGVAALVSSGSDIRGDAAAQAQSGHVLALLSEQRGFQRGLDYPATHLPALVSRDGHQTLVLAAFSSHERSAKAVEHVASQLAGSDVLLGGNDVAFSEINKRTSSDLARAEAFAFPILLLLSFWVFRGLIAAALPLLVGGFAIVTTFLLLRAIDQFVGVSIFAVNLITGLGLGLSIDYSLFILSRYREELARSLDTSAAISRTLQTAGRTVLFGSLTVAGALASMLVFPLRFLYSMGIGGALVTLSAGAISLIVLPAVLVALGPRINALAPARLQRTAPPPIGDRSGRTPDDGVWYRLARGVMRRPGFVAAVTATVLIVIALPALRAQLAPGAARVLPSSSPARQVAETVTDDFAVDGSQALTMVFRAPANARQAVAALAQRAQIVAAHQANLAGPARYLGRGAWEIEMLPRGKQESSANQGLVHKLRALASAPTLLVGGATAGFVDQKAAIAANTSLTLVILTLVTGGVLFLMTASLVLPFVALVMNLLTVAVGAGLLVLIFQDGHLSRLLAFSPIGGLEESNLVLLFIIAFALSTDYGVFLLGRIKEAHDGGLSTREAVAHGLERTGRLITAAALLFCVAIGAFASSHIFFIKQLGVGAALAVLIDATVVRALLVPALIGLLGERTWWAPRPLRRLHARIGLPEGPRDGPRERLSEPTGA